jgi:hypothetical protein
MTGGKQRNTLYRGFDLDIASIDYEGINIEHRPQCHRVRRGGVICSEITNIADGFCGMPHWCVVDGRHATRETSCCRQWRQVGDGCHTHGLLKESSKLWNECSKLFRRRPGSSRSRPSDPQKPSRTTVQGCKMSTKYFCIFAQSFYMAHLIIRSSNLCILTGMLRLC